ncbi:MAG TPA: VOC family protein [Amnibacterium sp.]|nr:VOC family protein [Amnibacterium sp.]
MRMRLEVVPLPVSDVDGSLAFYRDRAGFVLDHDVRPGGAMRVVQLTPPGSACSIVFGVGITDTSVPPGSVRGLHLVVDDAEGARTALLARGVDVGEVQDLGGVKYAHFADPDGNSWALQEITSRALPI